MSVAIPVSGVGFETYEVLVGRGLVPELGRRVADLKPSRVVVITDETVAGLHGAAVMGSLEAAGLKARILSIPPGERSKSFGELERVIDRLLAYGLDRRSLVIALGGGVVGDLAGLAAALYMRGIRHVQVPTTLLAQVDSSVGGKTAIDTPRGKNLVGAFHQPRLVLADIALLGTLPARQVRSGWAEVIKHGLIADRDFFGWLSAEGASGARGEPGALERAVKRSVEIKSAIVGEDEREAARRALLNLGHTFGHALEAELGFDEARLTHGEAVALGCALAFRLSAAEGHCGASAADRVEAVLRGAGLPTRLADAGRFSAAALVRRMAGDKKAADGRMTLILARDIGDAFVARGVEPDRLLAFLQAEGAA